MTFGAQAVMATAQHYVRTKLFEHGRVGVRAVVHYGKEFDVVHAKANERVEDFVDFAFDEMNALGGFAVTLIHQWCDEMITITVSHRGAVHSDTFDVHSLAELN
jgi:hypothetical protein